METDNNALRELVRILIQHQSCQGKAYDTVVAPDGTSFEKLRVYLSKLIGVAGFQVLFARALSQAKRQCPSLNALQVTDGGVLEGLGKIAPPEMASALEVLLAHLLGLLIAFIGEALTVQILRDIWPDMPAENINLRKSSAS